MLLTLITINSFVFSQDYTCFDKNYKKGVEQFEAQQFDSAYNSFIAAKYGCGIIRPTSDIDKWILKAQEGELYLLQKENEILTKNLQAATKEQARIDKIIGYLQFKNNRAWVKKENNWILIDTYGSSYLQLSQDTVANIRLIDNGYSIITKKKKLHILDTLGKQTTNPYSYISKYKQGLAYAQNDKAQSTPVIINKKGGIVYKSDSILSEIYPFSIDTVVDEIVLLSRKIEYGSKEKGEAIMFGSNKFYNETSHCSYIQKFECNYIIGNEKSYFTNYSYLYSKYGDRVIEDKFYSIEKLSNNYYCLSLTKGGFSYTDEKKILKPDYSTAIDTVRFDKVEVFTDTLLLVNRDQYINAKGLISLSGDTLIKPEFVKIEQHPSYLSTIIVTRETANHFYSGLFNLKTRNYILGANYSFYKNFLYSEGTFAVRDTNLNLFFIDTLGNTLTQKTFFDIEPFTDGFAKVALGDSVGNLTFGYINKAGKLFTENLNEIYQLNNGVAVFNGSSYCYYLNHNGELEFKILKFGECNCSNVVSEGFSKIFYSKHKYSKQKGYVYITDKGKYAFGLCFFEEAEDFKNGKAKVKKDGLWFYINTKGECIDGDCPENYPTPNDNEKK